ncbi:MAG: hypothetical protein Q9M45_14140 [Robiginitomaculum sp.]|nr:hypothetical protein [Robiginitomaculum sp.]
METAQPSVEPVRTEAPEASDGTKPKRPVRRRRKAQDTEVTAEPVAAEDTVVPTTVDTKPESDEKPKRPVRRRRKARSADTDAETAPTPVKETPEATVEASTPTEEKPKRPVRRRRKVRSADTETEATTPAPTAPVAVATTSETDDKPKRPVRRRRKPDSGKTEATPAEHIEAPVPALAKTDEKPKRPVRRRRKPAGDAAPTVAAQAPAQTQNDAPPVEESKPKRRAVRPRKTKAAESQKAPEVIATDENPTTSTEDGTSDKGKKSWWARRFNA